MSGGKQADELGSTLTPRPVLYKRYGGQSTPETEGMSSQENSDIKTKQTEKNHQNTVAKIQKDRRKVFPTD